MKNNLVFKKSIFFSFLVHLIIANVFTVFGESLSSSCMKLLSQLLKIKIDFLSELK